MKMQKGYLKIVGDLLPFKKQCIFNFFLTKLLFLVVEYGDKFYQVYENTLFLVKIRR